MRIGAGLLAVGGAAAVLAALSVRLLVPAAGPVALPLGMAGLALLVAAFFRAGGDVERFLGRRSTREGGSLLGTTLFLAGSLVLVNILAGRFSVHADLTRDHLFTLAPETVAALHSANDPPRITAFYPADHPQAAALYALLDAARREDPRLTTRFVDPREEPLEAMAFDLGRRAPGGMATVVEIGDRHEMFFGQTEEELVGALRRAARERRPAVGFVTGHGEAAPGEQGPEGLGRARAALQNRGYRVRSAVNLAAPAALDTLDVLIVAGARFDWAPAEAETLLSFLDRGGRAMVLADPKAFHVPSEVLARGGFRAGREPILDPTRPEPAEIRPDYGRHPVTLGLREQRLPVVLPGAVEILFDAPPAGVERSPLLRAAAPIPAGEAVPMTAPRLVGASATWAGAGGRARLLVLGDMEFATDAHFETYGNGDLFLAAVEWLADEEGDITLRPRTRTDRPVFLTRQQGRTLWVLLVILGPLGVLGAGVSVWWKRR